MWEWLVLITSKCNVIANAVFRLKFIIIPSKCNVIVNAVFRLKFDISLLYQKTQISTPNDNYTSLFCKLRKIDYPLLTLNFNTFWILFIISNDQNCSYNNFKIFSSVSSPFLLNSTKYSGSDILNFSISYSIISFY